MGRAVYDLGLLLSHRGVPESEEYVERGRKIYASISPGAFPEAESDPFHGLIHPFYW